jgi:hypothetical protein
MEADVKATILGLISAGIGLFAIYFEEYRVIIISLYSIILVGYILFTYLSKIEEHENKIKELEKSFKRAEDLIKVRADIESLKRGGRK